MSQNKEQARILYNQAKRACDSGGGNDHEAWKTALLLLEEACLLDPDNAKFRIRRDHMRTILTEFEVEDSGGEAGSSPIHGATGGEDVVEDDDDIHKVTKTLAKTTIQTSARHVYISDHKIRRDVYEKLYDYQKRGLEWLLSLYDRKTKRGGILADDMGLGKTIQTIVLVSSLLETDEIKSVLIIAPNTLLLNWAKEFNKWYPDIDVYKYHEGTIERRLMNLRAVQRRGGVLLSTYGLMQNHAAGISEKSNGSEFIWDYVILDEAHKIKNPTKTTKAVHGIPSRFRLAISGTPVQNNLKELWSIYDWVLMGTLFDAYSDFKTRFEKPIEQSREKNASENQKYRGKKLAAQLRQIYEPFFLRRTKNEVFDRRKSGSGDMKNTLPTKYDWVIWIKLTDDQIQIYKDILSSPEVKQALMKTNKSPLVQLTVLKKLCDHPYQLPRSTVEKLLNKTRKTKNSENIFHDLIDDESDSDLVRIDGVEDQELIRTSGKLALLVHLLENLRSDKHRTLVFSQSTRMLDIIQKVLSSRRFIMARLDGRVSNRNREVIVNNFQESSRFDVMLLTTGVGGVGLTLTNADRVVIYDPCWNPATDSQAIDRVYRIGQERNVIVYRLITCASVEERIFRRQVFKSSIINQTVESKEDPTRYFTDQDIRELFKFTDPSKSETWQQIEKKHGSQRIPDPKTDDHREYIKSCSSVYNVSDHGFLFSRDDEKIDLPHSEKEYIKQSLERDMANLKIRSEEMERNKSGEYTSNFVLKIPESNPKTPTVYYDPLPNPTEITPSPKNKSSSPESVLFAQPEEGDLDDSDIQFIRQKKKKDPFVSDDETSYQSSASNDSGDQLPLNTSIRTGDDDVPSIHGEDANQSVTILDDSDTKPSTRLMNASYVTKSSFDHSRITARKSYNRTSRSTSGTTPEPDVTAARNRSRLSTNDSNHSTPPSVSRATDPESDDFQATITSPFNISRSGKNILSSTRHSAVFGDEYSSHISRDGTKFADSTFGQSYRETAASDHSSPEASLLFDRTKTYTVSKNLTAGSIRKNSVRSPQSGVNESENESLDISIKPFDRTNHVLDGLNLNTLNPKPEETCHVPAAHNSNEKSFADASSQLEMPSYFFRSPEKRGDDLNQTESIPGSPDIFFTPSSVTVRKRVASQRLSVVPVPLNLDDEILRSEDMSPNVTLEKEDDQSLKENVTIQSEGDNSLDQTKSFLDETSLTSSQEGSSEDEEDTSQGSTSSDASFGAADITHRTVSPEY